MIEYKIIKYCRACKTRMVLKRGEMKIYCDNCKANYLRSMEAKAKEDAIVAAEAKKVEAKKIEAKKLSEAKKAAKVAKQLAAAKSAAIKPSSAKKAVKKVKSKK